VFILENFLSFHFSLLLPLLEHLDVLLVALHLREFALLLVCFFAGFRFLPLSLNLRLLLLSRFLVEVLLLP